MIVRMTIRIIVTMIIRIIERLTVRIIIRIDTRMIVLMKIRIIVKVFVRMTIRIIVYCINTTYDAKKHSSYSLLKMFEMKHFDEIFNFLGRHLLFLTNWKIMILKFFEINHLPIE